MKTKHFTSVVPPSTEKTIRLPLPAIEVRERSPFKKYRRNVVEIETTPILSVAGSLQLEQLRIAPALCDKFFVCPRSFHLTISKDENAVGHADA
jgi:hypothetical protein